MSSLWRFCAMLSLFSLSVVVSASEPTQIDRLTQQWLGIEQQARYLQREWKTQQPLLMQRIEVLQAEKRQLEAQLVRSSTTQDDTDSQRAEGLKEQAALEKEQMELAHALKKLQPELDAIAHRLPPVLSEVWQEEQRALDQGASASVSLQVALAQLTHVVDFDQRISVSESIISLEEEQRDEESAGGESVEKASPLKKTLKRVRVKQLFLGLGMAWFISSDGHLVGWGQATETGWHWYRDNALDADEIAKAIAMYEKERPADWVRLPVRLSQRVALEAQP